MGTEVVKNPAQISHQLSLFVAELTSQQFFDIRYRNIIDVNPAKFYCILQTSDRCRD